MKKRSFNRFLLFSLFGIALGFFGTLYEGLVLIPKMLNPSAERMAFWKQFYSVVNPVVYYIPLLPLAAITVVFLYFKTAPESKVLKRNLMLAVILQAVSLLITFYIVNQVNLKMYFCNVEKYSSVIPGKTLLVNILSPLRLMITALAMNFVFKAYLTAQNTNAHSQGV